MSERRGVLVPHTHWDRAWYQPYEAFRLRFVRMLDSLLELMESLPDFKTFTLDGQCAILEDYLEIRPDNRKRLEALARNGRMPIGPWYTLPDIFLAGGEAIIRNLQTGLECVAKLEGRGPHAGYVPDSFGHFAQMPQILQGFGIDSYIFMRGLDSASKEKLGAIFSWRAPNGSEVLATYMVNGYLGASALGLPADWGRFDGQKADVGAAVEKLRTLLHTLGARQKESTVLLPNGCDHMPPQRDLPEIVKAAQAAGLAVEIGSYADYLKHARAESKPHGVFEGDLLGNADHPILSSVYSTRTPLKLLNHAAQSLLTRVVEPWLAWTQAQGAPVDAKPFWDTAWKKVLRNHAHDDICGCSVDAVHQANETHFAEAIEIGRTLVTESLEALKKKGFQAPDTREKVASEVWLFNPHPFVVTADCETSILVPNPAGEWATPTPECAIEAQSGDGNRVDVKVLASEAPAVRSAFLETTWGRRYKLRLRAELPPLGYTLVSLFEKGSPAAATDSLENGIEGPFSKLEVENSRLIYTSKAAELRLEDVLSFEYELDGGDTYSFSPVPGDSTRRARLISHCKDPRDADTLHLEYELEAPVGLSDGKPSSTTAKMKLFAAARLELSGGVTLSIRYTNIFKNGRLRAVFAPQLAGAKAFADHPFRLAELSPETHTDYSPQKPAYPGERPYPTRFQGDFLLFDNDDKRAWLANRGLREVEIIERNGAPTAALTLHRSVGFLSVSGGGIRACQAGPALATPEAQLLRELQIDIAFGVTGLTRGGAMRTALAFAHPPEAREMPVLPAVYGAGPVPRSGSLLEVSNSEVLFSALKPAANSKGDLALRLYNTSGENQKCRLRAGLPVKRYARADLTESWQDQRAQHFMPTGTAIELAPYEILTLLLKTS